MLLKLRQKTTKCMRSASIIALFVPYIYGKLSFYISNIYKCVILKIIYDRHPPPHYKKRKKTYSQHKGILSSKLHECTSKDILP